MDNYWAVIGLAALGLIAIAAFYLPSAQYLWFLFFGTIYDNVPWLFSWLVGDNFVVSPAYDPNGGGGGGLSSLDDVQQAAVFNLVLFAIVMTYFAASTTTTPIPPLSSIAYFNGPDKERREKLTVDATAILMRSLQKAINNRRLAKIAATA